MIIEDSTGLKIEELKLDDELKQLMTQSKLKGK